MTIEPPPAALRAGAAARAASQGPREFTTKSRSKVSAAVSSMGVAGAAIPAFAHRTVSFPYSVTAARTAASLSASTDTSARTAIASPPACRMRSQVACAACSLRSTTTTFAPSRAKRRAPAFPIPEPPPVIRATSPSSLITSSSLSVRHGCLDRDSISSVDCFCKLRGYVVSRSANEGNSVDWIEGVSPSIAHRGPRMPRREAGRSGRRAGSVHHVKHVVCGGLRPRDARRDTQKPPGNPWISGGCTADRRECGA